MKTIPIGYKETNIGVFPINWDIMKIGEVLTIGSGKDYKHLEDGDIPVYGSGGYMLSVNKYLYDGESVCIGRKGTIDKPILLNGKFWTVDTLFYSHSYINLIPKFLYLLFLNINWKKYNEASGVPSLSKSTIETISIALPPLKEQEKIAEILTTWDDAVRAQEELIKAKNEFRKGLIQNLLSGKIRFSIFTDIWDKIVLHKVLKERKEYSEKGLKLEHVSLTKEGVVPKSERYERDFLVKDDNKKYKVTYLNDICYNPANLKFGVICKNTLGNRIFSPIYVTFEVKENNSINYLGYLLTWNDFIGRIRKFEQGTVYERMAVSPKDFLSYTITLPSLQEQEKIAEVLINTDREINLLENELEELKEQKKGLIQKLLTGEVKVEV
jgi:type I restriction enzyme, S subunit